MSRRGGLAVLGAAALAAGCSSSAPPPPTAPPAVTSLASSPGTPPVTSPAAPDPVTACGERLTAGLSEAQRIGQLFVVGVPLTSDPAAALATAAAVHAGGAALYETTTGGTAAVHVLVGRVQAALRGADGGVPAWVTTDQEGGQIQALNGPGFARVPPARAQGLVAPDLLQRQAQQWGHELAAAGVGVDFAPVLDVVPLQMQQRNQPIGLLQRDFGPTPDGVTAHGLAVLRGLRAAGVAPTAKHFPGLGRVVGNTDFAGGVHDTVTTADDPDLAPFAAAVRAGVPLVMVSTAVYDRIDPTQPAAFSPVVVTGLLRGRLGFRGLAVSDDVASAAQVAGVPLADRAVRVVAAGGDLVIAVKPATAVAPMVSGVVARAAADAAFRRLVDEAARAVVTEKVALGVARC